MFIDRKIPIFALAIFASIFPPAMANAQLQDEALTSNDIYSVAVAAKTWSGTRYKYGGKDKNGVDCSHFVFAVYSQVFDGYDYRMASEYLNDSDFSPTRSPLIGDLIVFPSVGGASAHMGIITDVRGRKFIGAQTSTGVKEASFAPGSYWGKRPYKILSLLPVE